MKNYQKYFTFGVIFWIIVDFTTTKAIKNPILYYSKYMPTLLIFYIGFPLLFSFLIYKFNFNNIKLFISTIIGAFIVEVIFTKNPLIITFPLMLLGIPVAICVYIFIIFVPKWIVDGEYQQNKLLIILMIIIYIIISLLTIFGSGS